MAADIEVGNLVAKVSMDDTEINKSFAELKRSMKIAQSEFEAAGAKLGDFGKSTDGLKVKAESLTKQIGVQQQIVAKLSAEHAKAAEEKGKDAKETQKLEVRLNEAQAKLYGMQHALKETNAEITKQSSSWTKLSETLNAAGKKMQDVGRTMQDAGRSLSMTLTAPIVALGGTALKTAIDFESAFAGVRKTVDATEAEFATFKQEIRDMSKTIPVAATEITKVAEAAGQLGIKKEAIMGFSRTMVDLGVATNMTSDQAATALARLANITQMPQSQFDRLGATIVELGNNLATTESEIVEMGLRIAGAGNQIGLTEAQILAFAGSLSSVGIEAEAGGSAISRVMIDIASAVDTGGKKLNLFAQVAGMSASDFQKSFKQDAAGAILTFIEGLGEMSASGKNTFGVLEDLGLSEIRVRDALLRASGAGDLFRNSIELGTQAWQENTALTNEAAERYKTTESQLTILWNKIKDVALTLGDALIPALMAAVDAMQPFIDFIAQAAEWFASLEPATQSWMVALAGIAAAIGPVVVIFGTLIQSVGTIASAFGAVSLAIAEAGGLMAVLTGPVGLAVAAIGGLVAAGVLLYENWDTIKEYAKQVWGQISDFIQPAVEEISGFITDTFGDLAEWWRQVWPDLKQAFENIWSAILAYIGPVMSGIKEAIVAVWPYVQNILIAAWETIKGVISGTLDIITGIIGAFAALFTGNWEVLWANVKQILSGAWQAFNSIISGGVQIVLNIIGGMIASITGYFTGIGKHMVQYGNDIVKGLGQGIIDMTGWIKEKVLAFVNGVSDTIKAFFGIQSPSKLMAEYGKYLVEGLWQGIQNMAGWIKEKVTTFSSDIANAIKNFFGIASPSKLMAEYGAYIAEGLAVGMRNNQKAVADAAKAQADIVKAKTQEAKDAAIANYQEMHSRVKTESDLMAAAVTSALGKVRETTNLELAIAKQEFELFASTLGTTTTDAASKLEAQMELLRNQLSVSNETVDLLKAAYDQMAAAKGANSEEAQKLYLELLKEQTAYQNIRKELDELENSYNKAAQSARQLVIEQGKIFENINGKWVEGGSVGGRLTWEDLTSNTHGYNDKGERVPINWDKMPEWLRPPSAGAGTGSSETDSGRRRPADTDKEGAYQKDVNKDNFGGGANTNVRSAVKSAGDTIKEALDKVADKLRFPGLATGGTVVKSGWTMVGEKGPELLNLPRGSQVVPNYDVHRFGGAAINYDALANALARVMKPSVTQYNNFTSPQALTPSETARKNQQVLRQFGLEWG